MQDAFRMGGWGMYPTLFVGLVLLFTAGRYALSPARGRLHVVIGLGVLTMFVACLGFVTGVIKTMTTASELEASIRESVIAMGIGESLNNIGLGLALLVLASIGAVVGLARRPAPPAAHAASLVDPLQP